MQHKTNAAASNAKIRAVNPTALSFRIGTKYMLMFASSLRPGPAQVLPKVPEVYPYIRYILLQLEKLDVVTVARNQAAAAAAARRRGLGLSRWLTRDSEEAWAVLVSVSLSLCLCLPVCLPISLSESLALSARSLSPSLLLSEFVCLSLSPPPLHSLSQALQRHYS